jgi:hypothetical protein
MLISYAVINNAPECSISLNIFLIFRELYFVYLVACYFRFLIMLHSFFFVRFLFVSPMFIRPEKYLYGRLGKITAWTIVR